jgi:hypothetical protein
MPSLKWVLLVVFSVSLSSSSAFAQHSKAAAAAPAAPAMTNDDVIGLASVGLSDDVIMAKIKSSPKTAFDTSVPGLKALKAGGVSSAVIRFMIDPTAPPPAPVAAVAPAPAAPAAPDPDDPMTPHTGFYVEVTGPDGKVHLSKILLTSNSGIKGPSTGSMLGTVYSFGLHKSKTKMILPGTKAETELTNASPVFWIYPGDDKRTRSWSSSQWRTATVRQPGLPSADSEGTPLAARREMVRC